MEKTEKEIEKAEKAAKTIKAQDAAEAYRLLTAPAGQGKGAFSLQGLDKDGIFAVLRAANALKPVATALEDFIKDARERLRPADWEEVVAKAKAYDTLPDAEKAALNGKVADYERMVAECVEEEAAKEHEVEMEPLSDEAFAAVVSANSHIVGLNEAMLLQSLLCKQ